MLSRSSCSVERRDDQIRGQHGKVKSIQAWSIGGRNLDLKVTIEEEEVFCSVAHPWADVTIGRTTAVSIDLRRLLE